MQYLIIRDLIDIDDIEFWLQQSLQREQTLRFVDNLEKRKFFKGKYKQIDFLDMLF